MRDKSDANPAGFGVRGCKSLSIGGLQLPLRDILTTDDDLTRSGEGSPARIESPASDAPLLVLLYPAVRRRVLADTAAGARIPALCDNGPNRCGAPGAAAR